MIKTGICSITFRQLDIGSVVELVKQAGLDAIEWGGDVHVLPGDLKVAQEAARLTVEAGLEVSSYGSYYSGFDTGGNPENFAPVLETALALRTKTIRIWSGTHSSESAEDQYRKAFIEKLRSDLCAAAGHGVRLALEFHANTLTDSNSATLALLNEVNHPNLYTYWQPMYWVADQDYRLLGLKQLSDRVLNLHVFHWRFDPFTGTWGENIERCPLEEGAADWDRYLSVPLPSGDHYALLEFVRNDDPSRFIQDAAVLKKWVRQI